VISKSNERAAQVGFEITNMVSDQNCTQTEQYWKQNWSSIETVMGQQWRA